MRILTLACVTCFSFLCSAPTSHAGKYAVRDAGFFDIERRPYRLFMLYDARTAQLAKERHLALQKHLSQGNVVLVIVPVEKQKAYPELKNIVVPQELDRPLLWLMSPDDRVTPFDPGEAPHQLLQSPLRHALLKEVTHSLAAVVLLESTNDLANIRAKASAEAVLTQINKVNSKLDKAPTGEVKLLTLPAAERNRKEERWTLWSLGEEIAPADTPKIAVLFGNMYRAGPLFEGTDWQEEELFSRIATLGQFCDSAFDRWQFFGNSVMFRRPSDWQDKLTDVLRFNPHDDAIKTELSALLNKPPLPEGQRKPRRLTFAALMAGEKEPDEGDAQKKDPFDDPLMKIDPDPELNRDEMENAPPAFSRERPSFDKTLVGGILLLAGMLGWLLLAGAVWLLQRRKVSQAPP